jgi:hypothetical protein
MLRDTDREADFEWEWLVSVSVLSLGSVMPVEPGREARTSVGREGCVRTVPRVRGPDEVKVKSGGRNQVGIAV